MPRHGPKRSRAAAASWSATTCRLKIAGPTNFALALIDFENLAAYQQYRDKLSQDSEAIANVARIARSGCILNEDRSILQRA